MKPTVVILTRHFPSFGVAAEALAAKTTCIVANTSALRKWIDNENYFGIHYPGSSDKLVSLINEVVRTELGEVELWDWDEVVKQLETVYTA